jgi:hypothetical protein
MRTKPLVTILVSNLSHVSILKVWLGVALMLAHAIGRRQGTATEIHRISEKQIRLDQE